MKRLATFLIAVLFLLKTEAQILPNQNDTTKSSRWRYSVGLMAGVNFNGYYKEISSSTMISLGVIYNFTNNWSLSADLRYGLLSYNDEFEEGGLITKTKLKSAIGRIPIIFSYNFIDSEKRKRYSIGVGFGYSSQSSVKVDYDIISNPNNAHLYVPYYSTSGRAGFGILKATKFFPIGKKSKNQVFVSLEGNIDMVSSTTFRLSVTMPPPTYRDSYSEFNLRNNLLFLMVGLNF